MKTAKTQQDFAQLIKLPAAERKPLVLDALRAGEIEARQAADLLGGQMPSGSEARSVGATPYGGPGGNARASKALPKNSPLFRAAEMRDLGEGPAVTAEAISARKEIDRLLAKIGEAGSEPGPAIQKLEAYLGQIGPDVVDAIRGNSTSVGDAGIGYVNARLAALNTGVVLEPIMDAQSRAFVRAARPGDLRGQRGSIHFDYRPYSRNTIDFARSQGRQDTGMWSATFSGMEAWNFKRDPQDGSVSAKRRDLHRGMNGGNLKEVVQDFISMLGEQAFPPGYSMEIDLDKVPKAQHGEVKAALAPLGEYGVELRYLETDPTKLMDAARDNAQIERRIFELLKKPETDWSPADRREYNELFALYNTQSGRRFESE